MADTTKAVKVTAAQRIRRSVVDLRSQASALREAAEGLPGGETAEQVHGNAIAIEETAKRLEGLAATVESWPTGRE